jgi:hypothetical protein
MFDTAAFAFELCPDEGGRTDGIKPIRAVLVSVSHFSRFLVS